MENFNSKKALIIGGLVVAVITLFTVTRTLVTTNDIGYYQVKQAAMSGAITVQNQPGTYLRLGGDIHTYHMSDTFYFSKHDIDGGKGDAAAALKVQFNDGSFAEISGAIKYTLPSQPDLQIRLHQEFKGYEFIQRDLIRQVVAEALLQTATLMKAEEFYSTRRSEFTASAEDQIKNGIFATVSTEKQVKDVEGNEFIERITEFKRDETGRPVVRKESALKRYGIQVISFVIKDVDFDATINALINKKKEAEQMKVVARANAEKAKQDAITSVETGKARVEAAKADELVEKIKATTVAQKDYEVSVFNHKKAGEDAASAILKGEADAKIAKQKVAAGLTPLERAQMDKDTAIGVAAELAKVQFPSMMVMGGGGQNGHPLNPFDAIGLKSFMDIQREISKEK